MQLHDNMQSSNGNKTSTCKYSMFVEEVHLIAGLEYGMDSGIENEMEQ